MESWSSDIYIDFDIDIEYDVELTKIPDVHEGRDDESHGKAELLLRDRSVDRPIQVTKLTPGVN